MLVLTRKVGESLKIGDNIELKILSMDGEQIKLGINAPREIGIHRKEVYLAIEQENSAAAETSVDLLNFLKNNEEKS
ncbi:carbon storage regulator CsrA [Terribacillus sp. AE2B 122]|uniref:carbon storage regulator CsrA n=1 Tax=Terribacillus sp. AE2B 122 TaxID=1331902 RepID=UPI0015840C9F|nr:carbon storage regulator CsrA [Terribacillus sp. AE2B 122]